jgi:CheY-like chemotaxis protein
LELLLFRHFAQETGANCVQTAKAKTLLCVEDDEALLRTICVFLRANGYVVRGCATGAAALGQMAGGSFYAAVLDYSLPDMNGGQLAAALRAQSPATPIIIFSGSVSEIPAAVLAMADVVLDKQQGIGALALALDRISSSRQFSTVRKYRRYAVQVPFVLTLSRSPRQTALHGFSSTLAEGGMGGILAGQISPGDIVCITLSHPELKDLRPRAEVRYKHGETYGFEFLDLSAAQQQTIRRSCEQLAASSI